jgi:hypothetical protein
LDFFGKIIHDGCGIDKILAMTDDGGLRSKEFILRGFFADVFERDGFGGDHGWRDKSLMPMEVAQKNR